jgi:hypothetical protein
MTPAMIRASLQPGHVFRGGLSSAPRPSVCMYRASPVGGSVDQRQPNKRLKLAARVGYGMNLSSARRSLSAIR